MTSGGRNARRMALTACTVVVGVMFLRRRRRSPLRLVVAWLRATPMQVDLQEFDVSPQRVFDVVQGSYGWFLDLLQSWVIDPLTKAVSVGVNILKGAVTGALHAVWTVIGDLGAIGDNIVSWVERLFHQVLDEAVRLWGVVDQFAHDTFDLLTNAGSWVWDRVRELALDALHAAADVGGWLWDRISDLVRTLLDDAIGAAGWLWDELRALVVGIITEATRFGGWLYNIIEAIVRALVPDGLGDALGAVGDLIGDFLTFVRWVLDTGADVVVSVFFAVWHLLVFIAEHPLDWWAVLADSVFRNGRTWFVQHVIGALNEDGDTFEQWVADHLSL